MDRDEREWVQISVPLYPEEVEIVRQVDERRGLRNRSAAIRAIIREWAEMNAEKEERRRAEVLN